MSSLNHSKPNSTEAFRRIAKRLHRSAQSENICNALPVIRRMHAANIFPSQSVPTLFRHRNKFKRKHFLRMLAKEAGYNDWEQMHANIDRVPDHQLQRAENTLLWGAKLHLWFRSFDEAQNHAETHGGQALAYGSHGLVVPPTPN